MKIVYLHQYFNTPDMNGGTRSYEMAKRFVQAGHEVHMITSLREQNTTRSKKRWEETIVDGIHVHWCRVPYSNTMPFAKRIMAFIKFAILSTLKSLDVKGDVIFATSTPLTISIPGVLASKRHRIPMVFEVRDLWPELPIAMGALKNPLSKILARWLEAFAYKNSKAIVALSPGMKEGILKRGFPSCKVAIIPNSSDIQMFQVNSSSGNQFLIDRGWNDDRPLIIYTGTFGLINGVSYLVTLAQELERINSNVRILAIGNGKEHDLVYERAVEAGVINKNFFIEDALPKKEIPAALNAATMACALFIDKPEMRANSANKFFDALAAGKPVMINYGGWMHDLIQEKEFGISTWKKSIEDAASEINSKINDKNWLRVASESSISLAKECFDRDVLACQLLKVLELAVSGEESTIEEAMLGSFK